MIFSSQKFVKARSKKQENNQKFGSFLREMGGIGTVELWGKHHYTRAIPRDPSSWSLRHLSGIPEFWRKR
jgi:hypothetical protein